MATALDLKQRLRSVFGHSVFRPHQEEVCRRTAEGADGLVVMPTGAGKSLCYQLPGLLRGGPTLVFSPLIALMEDQTAKLRELDLRAERIHSGRPRSESRQACRLYRDGELDFLFIAPERLGVPGFIEFLERCRPALIAVDEAHCISQWGHDFRPDYRLLGERLPALRRRSGPASEAQGAASTPILALTATATPRIQEDIVIQLGLEGADRHIHGFRRSNLAIEVAKKARSARPALVAEVLTDPERRPAIVYCPTRKETEALARLLADRFPTAAYHAGMATEGREEAQSAFQAGGLEVVAATTAFGMGVDKPDIRTVIHTAMPSTVEGYYQEIGRAGRDGQPSRSLLLYSWADRRTQEFLHGLTYPELRYLERLHGALSDEPVEVDDLARRLRYPDRVFEAALDQLRIHGAARILGGGLVRRTRPSEAGDSAAGGGTEGGRAGDDMSWRRTYRAQRRHRLDQIDEMTRFADHRGCRMLRLVRHFGDRADSGEPCGVCDVCAASSCLARRFRTPLAEEVQAMETVVSMLRRRDGVGTGRLFQEFRAVHGSYDRGAFEDLLGALAQARVAFVEEDSFQKDGETIRYQRAGLTPSGRRRGVDLAGQALLPDDPPNEPARRRRRRPPATAPQVSEADAEPELVEVLRAWRLEQARKRRWPAYTVLTNNALIAVAARKPANRDELLALPGIGPKTVKRYGGALLRIVAAAEKADEAPADGG